MDKETILSLLRHALTTLGGWLVGRGFLSAEVAPELIGSLVTLAGIAWGWFSARTKTQLKTDNVTLTGAVEGTIGIDHPKVLALVPAPNPVDGTSDTTRLVKPD